MNHDDHNVYTACEIYMTIQWTVNVSMELTPNTITPALTCYTVVRASFVLSIDFAGVCESACKDVQLEPVIFIFPSAETCEVM